MKRSLKEELERIHSISYGKNVILEDNFITSLLNPTNNIMQLKVSDDPKKADLLNNDPNNFFKNLESINQPVYQEESGSIEWHKEVETFQIALELLGYELPVYGVDGKFGPETASAVKKFKQDNNIISESISPYDGSANVKLRKNVDPNIDDSLQSKIDAIAAEYDKPFEISSGYRNPEVNNKVGGVKDSQHLDHNAVDIVLNNQTIEDTLRFVEIASKNGIGGIGIYSPGVLHIDIGPRRSWGKSKHSDSIPSWAQSTIKAHLANKIGSGYVSDYKSDSNNTPSANLTIKEVVTPEMAKLMLQKLKLKGVTKEELAKYTDYILTSGAANMTDLNLSEPVDVEKYAKICDAFIQQRPPNLLHITGRMLALGAQRAFTKYHKYVPPELALAQLAAEGGIGNSDPNSRPIATKNPFDVGNTETGDQIMPTVEIGVNEYYDLIAKSYLGRGKTASDLLTNFVNNKNKRYAGAVNYEKVLASIAKRVNKLSNNLGFSS